MTHREAAAHAAALSRIPAQLAHRIASRLPVR
ncbi:hypothetical protein ABIC49_005446 [Burkholderia ambifaria]